MEYINKIEKELKEQFDIVDNICFENSLKVLNVFLIIYYF